MITRVLSVLLIVLGVAAVVRTAAEGVGGGLGFVLGAVLVLAGVLRLSISRRAR